MQLWADKFQGVLEDVFEIQERLGQIVDALRLRLTPTEDRRLAQRPIGDVRGSECYLLARRKSGVSIPNRWTTHSSSSGAEAIVGDNELLFVAEGLIDWQDVNVGIVPVSQYDQYLHKAGRLRRQGVRTQPESSKGHELFDTPVQTRTSG